MMINVSCRPSAKDTALAVSFKHPSSDFLLDSQDFPWIAANQHPRSTNPQSLQNIGPINSAIPCNCSCVANEIGFLPA